MEVQVMQTHFRSLLLAAAGLLLFFSCTPIPTFTREPAGEAETLVIGQVLFDCQLTKTGSIPIGKYSYNVELQFEDASTGNIMDIKSVDPQGFFYFHNPGFSQVYLVGLYYEQYYAQPDIHKPPSGKLFDKETSKLATAGMTLDRKKRYAIQPHKVNNLGLLLWEGDMRSRSHHLAFNRNYSETRENFKKRYPQSRWNNQQWVEVRAE
jgi:hypothetical protein